MRGVEDIENVEGDDALDNVTGDVSWDDAGDDGVGNGDGEGSSEDVAGIGGTFVGIEDNAETGGEVGFVAIEADSAGTEASRDRFDLGCGWGEDGAVDGISAVLRDALTVGADEPADDGIGLWRPDRLS